MRMWECKQFHDLGAGARSSIEFRIPLIWFNLRFFCFSLYTLCTFVCTTVCLWRYLICFILYMLTGNCMWIWFRRRKISINVCTEAIYFHLQFSLRSSALSPSTNKLYTSGSVYHHSNPQIHRDSSFNFIAQFFQYILIPLDWRARGTCRWCSLLIHLKSLFFAFQNGSY